MAMYTSSIGAGGSFAEYGIDLADNVMLVIKPARYHISDASPPYQPGLYHGKRGHGISVKFSLKTGLLILGLVNVNSEFRFIGG
jgi:hypothetical protein